MTERPKEFVVVAGPTGSGKSALAMALALDLGGEIVGCDSVQIYRGFDIGSAKPSVADQSQVPHHLVDLLNWNDDCDAALYAKWAGDAIDNIRSRGRLPIVVGGTGLYLRALLGRGWNNDLPKDEALRATLQALPSDELFARLKALDPARASELHINDRFRVVRALELVTLLGRPLREAGLTGDVAPPHAAWMIGIEPKRDVLQLQLAARIEVMLQSGLVEEVQSLLGSGVLSSCKPMHSIGYAETIEMLEGRMHRSALAAAILVSTRRYAKRQMNWNRKVVFDFKQVATDIPAALLATRAALGR